MTPEVKKINHEETAYECTMSGSEGVQGVPPGDDSAKILDNVSPWLRPSVIAWPAWYTTATVDNSFGAIQSRKTTQLILTNF